MCTPPLNEKLQFPFKYVSHVCDENKLAPDLPKEFEDLNTLFKGYRSFIM